MFVSVLGWRVVGLQVSKPQDKQGQKGVAHGTLGGYTEASNKGSRRETSKRRSVFGRHTKIISLTAHTHTHYVYSYAHLCKRAIIQNIHKQKSPHSHTQHMHTYTCKHMFRVIFVSVHV